MIIIVLIPFFIIALIHKFCVRKVPKSIKGRHVVITGGSSGIGKALAILCAQQGADVTIIARDESKLNFALNEIKRAKLEKSQKFTQLSVDVSNYKTIEARLHELEQSVGPIFLLANCAGFAQCQKIEDFTETDIDKLIKTNILGTLYPIKALIRKFKQRNEGIFVLCGSQASLMGMFGLSVYSSCKFALRGLAESMQMELKPFNISVTLALPPDTDTPGFERENLTKPKETKLISESGGLFKPEEVARGILQDALIGEFFSFIGFESFILTTLCVGMAPFSSYLQLLVQVALLGPLRMVATFYSRQFNNIVQKCHLEKEIAGEHKED